MFDSRKIVEQKNKLYDNNVETQWVVLRAYCTEHM